MKNAILRNLAWFENSGVMLPVSGEWGVAERVALSDGNCALEAMKLAFHAWTRHDGYFIIEQRRADCNFEAAYLYLLAYELFDNRKYYETARNILDYLYFRSGLLNRSQMEYQAGSWNWSHIKRENCVFFDDEAWCVFFQLEIAEKYPELAAEYDMESWALKLAKSLLGGSMKVFLEKFSIGDNHWVDYSKAWLGSLDLPHWGSLSCVALARAFKASGDLEYLDFVRKYHDYLSEKAESFIASEQCYGCIGACAAFRYTGDVYYKELAERFGKLIVGKMDSSGNLPAEHYEAPTGKHLVDTIYTANWALLGLQSLASINGDFSDSYRNLRELILRIQDKTEEKQLYGCWRGMFDLEKGQWGGGDCFEGGAGSIYTGWTNAPITSALIMDLLKRDLFSH